MSDPAGESTRLEQKVPRARRSYTVRLSEKPCAVKFVEEFNGFIVGTYDCLPDVAEAKRRFPELIEEEVIRIYEETNHRIGSLNFLSSTNCAEPRSNYELQVVHKCDHGGIFDMSIVGRQIYAAHANGYVARYEFHNQIHFSKLDSIKVATNESTLLTSIDTCEHKGQDGRTKLLGIVGDSSGRITLFDASKMDSILADCHVTSTADPVWQVKFLPNGNGDGKLAAVLVAAEDSSWYIYAVSLEGAEARFKQIYTNQGDFKAGVTSICFPFQQQHLESHTTSVLLGSYDESIRRYELTFAAKLDGVRVEGQQESAIVISGGGIWRLNRVNDRRLYIAAMYAGTYRIDLSDSGQRTGPFKLDKIYNNDDDDDARDGDVGANPNNSQPLHYGVDLTPEEALACVVDYNNNLCIFVEQH